MTSLGWAGVLSIDSRISRPTISDASDAGVASVGSADPTTRPLRSTVMRSATASTSRSLWVMKTIDLPWSVEALDHPEELVDLAGREHRGGLVEDQDRRVPEQRLDQLDPLLLADRQVLHPGVGVDGHPEVGAEGRDALRAGVEVEQGTAAQLVAQHHVLGDRERLHQLEVLVDHADAVGDGVGRAPEAHGLALDDELAGVGLVEPEDHVHERRLAGAVLAQQAVDLAAAELEVDGVVGQDAREPLGDPAGGEDDVGRRFGRRDGGGTRHA